MKAIIIEDYAEFPDFKIVQDHPKPKQDALKDHQVLVRVHAAGINPGDCHMASGRVKMAVKLKFPCVLGLDASGVVSAVGKKVTQFKVGDLVCGGKAGAKTGTFAEYCVFEDHDLIKKPKDMDYNKAAAFATSGGTIIDAYRQHPLVESLLKKHIAHPEKMNEKPKEMEDFKVLVIGASGGTGSIALLFAKHYLAKYFNIKVYAVCSTRNVEYVKSLGADVVIDYTQTSAKDGTQEKHQESSELPSICELIKGENGDQYIDLVIDCVGGYYFYDDVCQHLDCRRADSHVVYSSLVPPGPAELTLSTLIRTGIYISSNKMKACSKKYPKYNLIQYMGKAQKEFDLLMNRVLSEGNCFNLIKITTFKMDEIKKAHEMVHSKRAIGKVVLSIE
ncbi:predicted protein [Naegleria gruberi]|uniref:Predicted protein n=1 Tax=Naegleria gruberi TaxID=5762 RepID=D2VPF4_NAEGR|nr:uncharacterized protein NAEGRDRAFT_51218 [Naegleria gruberi]EFC41420.1 predicted protein [Naegleria gruberi]|eukprot:XP_002674164.1 predicted protein [Naegleria gruberi strain NEG-M]